MRYENVTEAREDFLRIVKNGERVVVTRNGQPAAVLLPFEEYQQLASIRDAARNPAALLEAIRVHERVQMGLRAETALDPAADASFLEEMRPIERVVIEKMLEMQKGVDEIRTVVERIENVTAKDLG
jgi:prevent-host-death family protein